MQNSKLASLPEAPLDESITIEQLALAPYGIYKRLRAEAPVLRVKALGRTLLTKASDTKFVKDSPEIFSTNDPNTPMKRAFLAHTLMRKDGEEHLRERNAMAPAFSPTAIRQNWSELYTRIATDYVARLPKGEVVDLFPALAGPFAAQCLIHLLGINNANDDQMQYWSQTLIDGAGNFGWKPEPFEKSDAANAEMDRHFDEMVERHKAEPNQSALSVMVNADDPIEKSQIYSNIKIAIGGGINEPRDALLTILFGLLTNPGQFEIAKQKSLWGDAFDEGVRWVAPIQVSSRLVKEDTTIRGFHIPKGDVVMTSQASANHDEEIWDNSGEFDLLREKKPHQAFGNGPHFCQGKHIARRMIADIMLPILFDRFPNMTLPDPGIVKFRGFGFRGPINLPVRLA